MKIYRSLTFKLSFIVLSIVLLIFSVMLIYNYQVSKKYLLKDAESDAEYVTRLTISEIEDALNAVENSADFLTSYFNSGDLKQREIKKFVRLLADNHELIISSFVYFGRRSGKEDAKKARLFYRKNNVKSKIEEHPGIDNFVEEWIKKSKQKNKSFWSEPYKKKTSGLLTSAYIAPAYNKNDSSDVYLGIIGIEISLDWLRDVISSKKIYTSDYIFILSPSGRPVIMPDNRFGNDDDFYSIAKKMNNPSIIKLGKKMIAGESGFIDIGKVFHDMPSVVYFAQVPSTNWSVGVLFPKNELFAGLYKTTISLILAGFIGFVIIFFVIIFVLRKMTRPLRQLSAVANVIGKGNFNAELPEINTYDEVGLLKDSFSTMQQELQTYIKNLITTVKEKERIESELKVAHEIQMGFLRKDFAGFSEGKNFEISALIYPSRNVGGDFYDFFLTDDEHLCISIGDVSGKGVPAALYMAMTLTLVRAGNYSMNSLRNVVKKINNAMCARNEKCVFVTFFIGILNLKNGEFTFCNAGHNYPYILKGNELFEMRATHGPPLGAFCDKIYKSGKLIFDKDDKIFLYTDGVTEAQNSKGDFFGTEKLEEILRETSQKNTGQIALSVYQDVKKFSDKKEPSDDITITALKYNGE